MLLGQNTVDCLSELIGEVDSLQNRIEYFIEEQQKFNDAVSQHTHNSPFYGIATLQSPQLIVNNMALTLNKSMT